MTTIISFKEQTQLTLQDRPNALIQSGCKMYTWKCSDAPIKNFTSIEFVNEYTAFLSIKIKQHADDEWHVCLKRYRLMESPHGEIGSNSHITLDQKQLIFMPRAIYQIRFILQQPSSIWKDFTIDNVKIHNQTIPIKDRKPSIERLLASTLINDDQMAEPAFTNIPTMNELSQHLQAMWAICAKMQQSDYGPEHIKRFDIDGAYDLQILSYT
ncbi:unnamed protein product [Rotaria magnacalcarata]|uniref:Uncharacterized protein n=3 Tax=Rotaria magnacalcarata TaxID=392030 RepID=A0A816QIW7_9BILA|nr:unnamed protein product [Rotaria magnacalcarata]CAF1604540.1 unnamed protein product [Rotaria magnacalcarata]CAF2053350.1 unnamed protein product [Rotaria magnacalcarata]CAF2062466.1 unnamed protein product [Rotaria magnacalcarata]CAF2138591.1 unnamed protein product [Rotaria magnacalcarata]